MARRTVVATLAIAATIVSSSIVQGAEPASYDLLIRNGMIYQGRGGPP